MVGRWIGDRWSVVLIKPLFKAVTIKLWWSEIPTSITPVFLKNSFLFVKIRSMQVGFEDWKQLGCFINYAWSNVVMNFSRLLLSIVRLKSPISTVLSYLQGNWPSVFDKWSIKYLSLWDGGIYQHTHTLTLTLTLTLTPIYTTYT